MIRSPLMSVMTEAVTKAARSLKRDFSEVEHLQVSVKGPGDFVTAADRKAEEILHGALEKARPDFGFVMEEQGIIEGRDASHRWHIDPLDGTTNFLHAIPHCCISVALERDGIILAGVVFDFLKDEWFIAERGQGAFLNNRRRLRVSARQDNANALVATGIPNIGRADHPRFLKELARTMVDFGGIRRMGAAALDLAYVGAGRYDAYWERNVRSWDIAAGILIVREAGGFVTNAEGGDVDLAGQSIAAGNESIHRSLVESLRAVA